MLTVILQEYEEEYVYFFCQMNKLSCTVKYSIIYIPEVAIKGFP